jgi:hypothetical protein
MYEAPIGVTHGPVWQNFVDGDKIKNPMTHKLIYTKNINTFKAYYLEKFFGQWFSLERFDQSRSLEPSDIMFLSLPESTNDVRLKQITAQVFDSAKAILVDNLQEPWFTDLDFLSPWKDKTLVLTAGTGHVSDFNLVAIPEWFWYFESLWYRSRNYHLYKPNTTDKSKVFLLPIRRQRLGRDLTWHGLSSMFDRSIYSYVERGFRLPGIPQEHLEDQRWFNPDWYDQTYFSVVCEDDDDSLPLCWSEKTCKPLAFFHPFVLVAQRGLLQLTRDHGFETFPEIFDESYDSLPDIRQRAEAVCRQILDLDINDFRAPEILRKTQYNYARFFDQDLVIEQITKRLIEPLLGFLETVK